jgi:hydrogenase maturation factor
VLWRVVRSRDVSRGVTWSAGLVETARTERWVVVHAGKCFQYCSTQEANLAMRSGAS